MLWAAVRFGTLGASTAISIVGFLAIWSASHGHGPFSGETPEQNALSIQIFLIVLAIPLLFLATVIEERVTGADRVARKRVAISGSWRMLRPFSSGWPAWTSSALSLTSRGWSLPAAAWNRSLETAGLKACIEMTCRSACEVYTSAFDARQPFVMQYRLRRNDGEYRWISDQGVPRYDAQGTFAGYIGSCVDVTELMTKDEALRQSEERMRLAAAAVNLGIWEWDLSKDEIWATNARRALLGLAGFRQNHVGRFHSAGCTPMTAIGSDRQSTMRFTSGEDFDSEYRLILPDGIVRWMSTRGSVHFDDARESPHGFWESASISRRVNRRNSMRSAIAQSYLISVVWR